MNKLFSILMAGVVLSIIIKPASAQTPELPPGPVYTVQEGDTLWDIAYLFQVSVEDIITYNNMLGQDIYIGDQLVIPGMESLQGFLSTLIVPFGETLRSLSRQYNLDAGTLLDLNKIVTPTELFAGYEILLLHQENSLLSAGRDTLHPDANILDMAVKQGLGIWEITRLNNIPSPSKTIPGDVFSIPGGVTSSAPAGFPLTISSVNIDPLPIAQGDTVQVRVEAAGDVILGGFLGDSIFHFFPSGEGSWVALQGIYALEEPGIYPLQISVTSSDGNKLAFEQMVLIKLGYFLEESLYVDQSLIDPEVTEPENQWLYTMTSPITPEKLWNGIFRLPVAEDIFCLRSGFGNRRSYNAGELLGFHSGLDFGICSESHPFDIYAPADGRVVFVGEKTVRGNVTILDHGWGVYSGFWHQEEISAVLGDLVSSGEYIGMIGSTGRVTGPHLHWEIWVSGIQVDPLQWLDEEFPHE